MQSMEQLYMLAFRNISFLFIEISLLFATRTVTKICNLLISEDLDSDERYIQCVQCLFLPVVQEDIDICDIFNCNILLPIDNDTPIAYKFMKYQRSAKFIFVFRYISILYNSFFKETINKKVFYDPKKITGFYLICFRLSHYLIMLKKAIKEFDLYIDSLYKTHVKNIIPVDIFVKERFNVDNKNPRYVVTPIVDEKKLELNVEYINNPYRVGYFSANTAGTNLQAEMHDIIVPNKTVMYSFNLAKEQLNINDPSAKLDSNIKALVTDDVRNQSVKETYFIGEITGYIEGKTTGLTEYPEPDNLLNKFKRYITDDQDIIVLGYGQSGSGKTSALIKLAHPSTKGIIPNLMDSLSRNDYTSLQVRFINIYLNWAADC